MKKQVLKKNNLENADECIILRRKVAESAKPSRDDENDLCWICNSSISNSNESQIQCNLYKKWSHKQALDIMALVSMYVIFASKKELTAIIMRNLRASKKH